MRRWSKRAVRSSFQFPIRRPRTTLVAVAVLACAAAFVGTDTVDHLSFREGDVYSHEAESFEATQKLKPAAREDWHGVPNLAVLTRETASTSGERNKRWLKRLHLHLRVEEYVFYSKDGNESAVLGWLREDEEAATAGKVADRISRPGVVVGGSALAKQDFAEELKSDLRRAELIAFPLLLVLGLWVFRSAVSALLPVMSGALVLAGALGCMRIADQFFSLSVFSLNLALALALGLGVDYSLLMVARFREELGAGRSPRAAAWNTVDTAGRTVAFSSGAIAASFSALLLFPIPFVRSMAFGGMLVPLLAGAIALVVLPALFSVLGLRVNRLAVGRWRYSLGAKVRPHESRVWYMLTRFLMRRPLVATVISTKLLFLLVLPALDLRLTGLDASSLPRSASTRVFDERIRRQFEHPIVGEIQVVIHGSEETAIALMNKLGRIGEKTGRAIGFPVGFKLRARLWEFNLNPTSSVFSDKTKAFIERLRHMDEPLMVTGATATYMDTVATLKRYLPYALIILGVTAGFFVVLATGSVVLAAKTLMMNALSLGAAFGLLVLIFQEGRFEELLNYPSQGAVVVILPLVMGAAAFGLLTDYGIFLLSRIREAKQGGLCDREAIAVGLERTGRIITGAALLFCAGTGAFANSGILFLKEAAVGIVAAVLIDAFVVRPILVPSLMMLLGRWNWWPGRPWARFIAKR